MKNYKAFKHFHVLLFFSLLLISACKQGLDERQKLFLDYAKLEDRYGNTGFYQNLDLYNLNTDPIVYKDSAFNIDAFKSAVVKNFKIWDNGDNLQPDLGNSDLQYPYQYIINKQKDGSYHTILSVFVPETYYKFSLSQKDIGKAVMKDSTEITLLDMTNDGATLLVENKSERQSYDYTYDIFEQKNLNKKDEEEPEPKTPGYSKYLFNSERIEEPNSSRIEVKDSLMRFSFARLNMYLADDTNKALYTEGKINDFRHYLWYRNHDMPFPDLVGDYMTIKSKYKELDKDPMHNFHPLYVVNLKAMGKVKQVDFFLRSKKGKVVTIDLGNVKPQTKNPEPKADPTEYAPLANIEREDIKKVLKINYTTMPVRFGEPDHIALYASVPYGYNNSNTNIIFQNVKLIGEKKDTLAIDEMDDASNYIGMLNMPRNWISPKTRGGF